VSLEHARNDYGVVLKPETFEIDWEATKQTREGSRLKAKG